MRHALLLPILLASLPLTPALAGDLSVFGGAALTFSPGGDKATRDDFNAYVEGEVSHVYFGVSGDLYNDKASDEVDLYLGYRNTTASNLSYDLSYTRNFYPNDGGDCCGDLALSLSRPLSDALTGTLDLDYYPESRTSAAYVTLDYALNDKITLTGSAGVTQLAGASDTKEYELAASYALGSETAVKLHYYDGSNYKGYLSLDLTWDTTLLGG